MRALLSARGWGAAFGVVPSGPRSAFERAFGSCLQAQTLAGRLCVCSVANAVWALLRQTQTQFKHTNDNLIQIGRNRIIIGPIQYTSNANVAESNPSGPRSAFEPAFGSCLQAQTLAGRLCFAVMRTHIGRNRIHIGPIQYTKGTQLRMQIGPIESISGKSNPGFDGSSQCRLCVCARDPNGCQLQRGGAAKMAILPDTHLDSRFDGVPIGAIDRYSDGGVEYVVWRSAYADLVTKSRDAILSMCATRDLSMCATRDGWARLLLSMHPPPPHRRRRTPALIDAKPRKHESSQTCETETRKKWRVLNGKKPRRQAKRKIVNPSIPTGVTRMKKAELVKLVKVWGIRGEHFTTRELKSVLFQIPQQALPGCNIGELTAASSSERAGGSRRRQSS